MDLGRVKPMVADVPGFAALGMAETQGVILGYRPVPLAILIAPWNAECPFALLLSLAFWQNAFLVGELLWYSPRNGPADHRFNGLLGHLDACGRLFYTE